MYTQQSDWSRQRGKKEEGLKKKEWRRGRKEKRKELAEEGKKKMEKGATLGRRFEGYTGYPGRWAPRYNTRLPLLAAISVNCSVPDKKNVGKIKFSSVIHHEATDAGRAGSIRIGWLRPKTFT